MEISHKLLNTGIDFSLARSECKAQGLLYNKWCICLSQKPLGHMRHMLSLSLTCLLARKQSDKHRQRDIRLHHNSTSALINTGYFFCDIFLVGRRYHQRCILICFLWHTGIQINARLGQNTPQKNYLDLNSDSISMQWMQTTNLRDAVAFASFNRLNKRLIIGIYFSGWGEGSDHRSMAGGQQWIYLPVWSDNSSSLPHPARGATLLLPRYSSTVTYTNCMRIYTFKLCFWRESVSLLHFSIPKASNKVHKSVCQIVPNQHLILESSPCWNILTFMWFQYCSPLIYNVVFCVN